MNFCIKRDLRYSTIWESNGEVEVDLILILCRYRVRFTIEFKCDSLLYCVQFFYIIHIYAIRLLLLYIF